mmetsp:Transcript_17508/g.23373  ORF Transcript_17508/g.23373 Transcript_17508/m.23373 type:complete len:111 (-) Transcript_17508:266-598(-)
MSAPYFICKRGQKKKKSGGKGHVKQKKGGGAGIFNSSLKKQSKSIICPINRRLIFEPYPDKSCYRDADQKMKLHLTLQRGHETKQNFIYNSSHIQACVRILTLDRAILTS